ncbi:MAG: magnesium/cobalt transporter CorA [Candidatus Omnitrophota bacterium]|jgi:magnesium transporter
MPRHNKKKLKKRHIFQSKPSEDKSRGIKITVIDYDEANFQEKKLIKPDECCVFKDKPTVTWVNVDGIHSIEVIEQIGKHFDMHPLIEEDITNTSQRPKYEDFGNYIFVVLKMLSYDEQNGETNAEHISLIVGQNFVISFQEKEGDIFDPIREKIRNAKGRIRKMGADYLAYALIDAIVDHYFVILEWLGEKIEGMEEELVSDPLPEKLQAIHDLKREMIFLRKSVWPLREVISGLQRAESSLIKKSTWVFLRDVYDHTIQVIDTIETYREMVSGMLDIYLSSISNKMNEVMKVLTIIATIFIPLTFITGIYGMNFRFMPELGWRFGYTMVWLIIFTAVIVMLFYFRKKKWL